MNLTKAFDCLAHHLIIAKLNAHSFEMSSLRFMQSYLADRYQEVKGNNSYSLWSLIKYGVPHGSILGRILFNIFLYHMFFLVDSVDIASYAHDNSYADAKWFPENGMNSNQDKRHFHSLQENSYLDNFHLSNSPLVNFSPSSRKISTQKIPIRNIPTHVSKHFVFSLLSPLSLKILKSDLLPFIKKFFAACLPFRKCFGYD